MKIVYKTNLFLGKHCTLKIILFTFLLLIISTNSLQAQAITVNDDSYTAKDLADLLVSNNCVTTSNYKTSSNKSVAYFNENNSNFPIKEGIILRNGIAKYTEGNFTDGNLSSELNLNNDDDLIDISNNSGQNSEIFDVAFLSFDFISQSSEFDFNFIFASNEYGEWQCGFSDVFGFILTDVSTGEKTNLAVLPNSNDIISVKSIRNNIYNSSCNSVNPGLFSTLNTTENNNSKLNMRGHTVVLNASSTIKTNRKYNLKLVIGDYGDTSFDSAVFIETGNFNKSFNIGDNFAMCENEPFTLNTQVAEGTNFDFKWFKDGELLPNEKDASFQGTKIGTYKVEATNLGGCILSDEIVISKLEIAKKPENLFECDNGVNTSFNIGQYDINYFNLDSDRYSLEYYNSIENVNAGIPLNSTDLRYYLSAGNETIYIKVKSRLLNDFCDDLIESFTLNTIQFKTTKPADIEVCKSTQNINIPNFVSSEILTNLNENEYTINYYATFNDAREELNPLTNATSYPVNTPKTTTLFARSASIFNEICFDIVEFNVLVFDLPKVDSLNDAIVCESFTLPELTNGKYFTRSNGTGNQFFAGDVLTDNQSVYIYNINENGCSVQTTFSVSILDKFELKENYCEKFVVFNPPNGNFFTLPGGENGGGEYILAGTELTTSQTIYYYALVDEEVCKDRSFDVVVIPKPKVDTQENIATCTSFTLPELTNGNYFTSTNGNGTELKAGTEISNNQKIYIYNEDRNCGNETSFEVFKINIDEFKNLVACDSYTLPSLNVGGYFTQANGQGEKIEEGTILTTSQEIFYFVETNEINNCTTNLSYKIDIFSTPKVDTINDVLRCINEPYILPELTNGTYYSQPNGNGTILNAGDVIIETKNIYIYNKSDNCDAETSFNVEIRLLPKADVFTDVFACKPFALPVLNNGTYYSEPNGQGEQLNAGDIITATKTIYIYNKDEKLEGCINENIFTVEYLGVEVDKLPAVNSCDSYTLPNLNVGEYFTQRNGKGIKMNPGDVITEDINLYIYAENGKRFFCSDEHLVPIKISKTPSLQNFDDQEGCGAFTLQEINVNANNKFEFYKSPNKVDLITPENYTLTTLGLQTIYAVESLIDNENCFSEKAFSVTIYPLLDLVIDDVIICNDYDSENSLQPVEIKSGLNPNKFSANWFFNDELVGSGVNFNALNAGTYRVEPFRIVPEIGADCNYKPTEVSVIASSPKAKITYLTDAFSDKTNISVDFINVGFGEYEYQLNDGDFQSDTIFRDLETGIYTITIRDLNNICPDLKIQFTAVTYPKYFTPNNDGNNDFWNIPDLKNNPEAIVQIHDRYGNFVTQFKTTEQGWNGFYKNGKESPNNSYWFKVRFTYRDEPTIFQAYFSLKRN